ncbi:acyl-CoA dehydrogenase family protein [Mycolicibacterium sp. S2-37]|nr:acyl-CoA dehydrogenase family protein [Mycolicibacterium sp. S2-37]
MGISVLAITEEHRSLADSALGALRRVGARAAARATLDGGPPRPAQIWSAGAALGRHGPTVSEAHGGSGFGLPDLAVVLEAQGRELCPGPFLPTVAAALVIDRCGGRRGRPRHDDRGRHVGDHPQHHRRADPRTSARPAAQVGVELVGCLRLPTSTPTCARSPATSPSRPSPR